jgi:hypothetical protein
MDGEEFLLEALDEGGARFDDEKNFGGLVNFSLPAVNTAGTWKNVHASREAQAYDVVGDAPGVLGGGAGGKYDDIVSQGSISFVLRGAREKI